MSRVYIFIIVVVIIFAALLAWFSYRPVARPPLALATSSVPAIEEQSVAVAPSAVVSAPTPDTHPGMKLYRNDEFGFEFWYPEGWEQSLYAKGRGYYSRFYLILTPNKAENGYDPLLVNVVIPKFTEQSFASFTPITTSVDGTQGFRYEYEFQSEQRMTVILPLGEYRIIIGTGSKERYGKDYEQILSTFKFLK